MRLQDLYERVPATERHDVRELLFAGAPQQPSLFLDLPEPDDAGADGPDDDAVEPPTLAQAEALVRAVLGLPG